MSLTDLGRRLFEIAQTHSKALLTDLRSEIRTPFHLWDILKSEIREHGEKFVTDLDREVRRYVTEESKRQGFQWSLLWGRDPEVEKAYHLLGLTYGITPDQVKVRWRDLVKESHPDRFMSDAKQFALATRKTQQLTEAYHRILKAFEEGRV